MTNHIIFKQFAMKLKLRLFATLLLFTFKGFSQVEAYAVPDINQCNYEVFNLTANTPVVLGNQDPENFTVTYFTSEADAMANANPILSTQQYVSNGQEDTIFIRVENNLTGEFDITSFIVSWGSPYAQSLNDVTTCMEFTLPELEYGTYYTGPGGTGTTLAAGTVISVSQTIYIYSQDGTCTDESSFTVTIAQSMEVNQPAPIVACDDNGDGIAIFNLTSVIPQMIADAPGASVMFYETPEDAEFGTKSFIRNTESTRYGTCLY